MFYICEEAHPKVRFISCDGHQLYDFKEHGEDLEVESLRYRDASLTSYVLGPPPARGGVNVSL